MKETILIADDSKLNQELLSEILGEQYDYAYADDGLQVIEALSGNAQVDIILLDIHMPNMDGFAVLKAMKEQHWIEEIPVIVISAESASSFAQQAYDLGATDYINRPFNASVVQHRVENTLMLYSKQKRLVQLVEEQIYQREKVNNTMINIFSHVIESRNEESGSHTLHMQTLTNLFLHQLVKISDRYSLTEGDISMISSVSALHDIGKIAVPKDILNKPGKLTEEEWAIMKSHTTVGDALLTGTPIPQDDPLMRTAHAICRWHHERWDGNGYPDGLKGDDIPISAQVVALADVYDALTSDRCYKTAFSHQQAIQMIRNGECGAFNPLLVQCLLAVADQLQVSMQADPERFDYQDEAWHLAGEMLTNESLPVDDRARRLLINEQEKKEFFARQCGGIHFEYDRLMQKVLYTNQYESSSKGRKTLYLTAGDDVRLLSKADWNILRDKLSSTTRTNPTVTMEALIPVNGEYRWHRITAMTVWPVRGSNYISALGQFTDIHDEVTNRGLQTLFGSGHAAQTYQALRELFDVVRLVDPKECRILEIGSQGQLVETPTRCYDIWDRGQCCENCTSARVLQKKHWLSKLEIKDGQIFSVLSRYLKVGERDCALEIALSPEGGGRDPGAGHLPGRASLMLLDFYRDALTNAYSRIYLDDFLPSLEQADGVAIIDVDQFKQINDTYGHPVGDEALKTVADIILACIRKTDALIRYGGDEFLLIFSKISESVFFERLSHIKKAVHAAVLKGHPEVRLEISIGGAYQVHPLSKAIAIADQEMYKLKSAHHEQQKG